MPTGPSLEDTIIPSSLEGDSTPHLLPSLVNWLRGEVQAATSERHGPLYCDAVGGFV